ncbi:MAG TPA: S8 family serine peptidase [Myxococcales bacterium]
MRRALWMSAPAAVIGILLVAAARDATATSEDGSRSAARFAKIDPALLESGGPQGKFVPASLSERPISVVLELAGEPVAVHSGKAKQRGPQLARAEKDAIRQQLRAQQDALHGQLANAGANIVGQMQDAYNGIHVIVPQKNVPQLASLPGVVALHAVRTFKPANVNGAPFIGAPQAWGNFGRTGAGVKVAVIDTGIDYTHADFGGPGTVAAFNAAKATSTAPAAPSLFGPGAAKVKGGFDFSGDDYNANDPASVPKPDPNPLDCNGHGTHTAGTAGGFGVLSNGSTYTGPYDTSTVSSHSWNVGPGVAPRAEIYAYRVFGCTGSSNIVDLAINRAVADGVNVISMSLGSDFGGTDDPTSVAAQNAFEDGIAVIASAGNAGASGYIVGSPSTSNGVLSVAAMDASVPKYPGAKLTLTPATSTGPVTAINANNASLPSGPFPVKVLRNADGTISLGCNEAEYAATAGKVVVTTRGTCARVARAVFGDKAGAAAVVMINNAGGYPPFEGEITENPDTGEKRNVTIPFLGVKNDADTVSALVAADGGSVTLAATTVDNTNYKLVAGFSSGGPRNPDSSPKPDVIAPGVSVASAGIGSGVKAATISGTSMACPMTAGIAALVKEAHPSWNGSEIKAAIMNTANPALNTGYNSRRAGTGVVQAQNAVNSSVLATTIDQLDAIAFGYVAGSGNYSASKAFTLTNHGSSSATYNLAVAPNGGQSGASVSVSPTSVTVPMGQTATVQVSLSMSASAFAALPSDDTFSIGVGGVLTVRGNIVATPGTGQSSDKQTLRLPYMFVPRGLSNVAAGAPSAWTKGPRPGNTFTSSVPLTNTGIHTGTADLYSWGITDPRESGQPMDVRNVGAQVLPGAALGGADTDRSLVFVINTWGQATNQAVNEYDIAIDNNGDGVADFFVVGVDLGAVLSGSANGQMASFTIDAATGAVVDAFYADAPMNGSTMELPALASELGIVPEQRPGNANDRGSQTFTYSVNAFSLVPGNFVDSTGSATLSPFSPAVSSGDFATLAPGASATMPLTIDQKQQKKTPALGWLVVSVDDANGAPQADEVKAPSKLEQ